MLVVKVNNSRILFINEFYIFIPLLLLVEGIIIMMIRRKLKKNREKGEINVQNFLITIRGKNCII